jgi:hypothetical protein
MITHLARFIRDEVDTWLTQRNGERPTNGGLERMAPDDPGMIPTSIRFTHSFTDYTTGTRHDIRVLISETTSKDRP